jgi:hypothetical protein
MHEDIGRKTPVGGLDLKNLVRVVWLSLGTGMCLAFPFVFTNFTSYLSVAFLIGIISTIWCLVCGCQGRELFEVIRLGAFCGLLLAIPFTLLDTEVNYFWASYLLTFPSTFVLLIIAAIYTLTHALANPGAAHAGRPRAG